MTDLSRNHFTGTEGSQVFVDDLPGVSWTSANTNASIGVQYFVSPPSSLRVSAGTSAGSAPQAIGNGWFPLPNFTSGGAETFVRWDDPAGGWATMSLLNSAGGTTLTMGLNFGGASPVGWATSGGQTNAVLPTALPVTAGKWYHIAVQWASPSGPLYFQFNGGRVHTENLTSDLTGIAGILLRNTGTGAVWFDASRVWPGVEYGVSYTVPTFPMEAFSAEFDREIGSPSISQAIQLTTFTNDIFAFRCRIVNVPECIRTRRAKNVCRKVWVAPEVLH